MYRVQKRYWLRCEMRPVSEVCISLGHSRPRDHCTCSHVIPAQVPCQRPCHSRVIPVSVLLSKWAWQSPSASVWFFILPSGLVSILNFFLDLSGGSLLLFGLGVAHVLEISCDVLSLNFLHSPIGDQQALFLSSPLSPSLPRSSCLFFCQLFWWRQLYRTSLSVRFYHHHHHHHYHYC